MEEGEDKVGGMRENRGRDADLGSHGMNTHTSIN